MSRYIDADKLIEDVRRKRGLHEIIKGVIYSFLHDAPTADVVEVKHGEWVYYQEHHPSQYSMFPDDVGECGWMCSCCNEFANRYMEDAYIYSEYNNKPKLPYCPNCGANMRGDNR